MIDQIQPTPIVISPSVAQPKRKPVKKIVKKAAAAKPTCKYAQWSCGAVNTNVTKINETDSKQVKDAKTDVATAGKRLACTGKALIATGAIGSIISIWQLFAARHIVEKILSHQRHGGDHHRGGHGGHHQWGGHGQGHHGHHGGHGGRGHHGHHSDVMTRTEFALIDNFRIMGFLMLSAFIAVSVSGCRALRAVRRGDAKFGDLVWRKTWKRIAWVVAMCAVIHHFGRECKHLLHPEEHEGRPHHWRPEHGEQQWRHHQKWNQMPEEAPEEPEMPETPPMLGEEAEPIQIMIVEAEPEEEDAQLPEPQPEDEQPEEEDGEEPQPEEEEDDEEQESGHGRHLRFRRSHRRKGGKKGRKGKTDKYGKRDNGIRKDIRNHKSKSRKLKAEYEGKSKVELLKELMALKSKIAVNQVKLETEEKFIEVDDKAIKTTEEKLAELIKNPNKNHTVIAEIEILSMMLLEEKNKEAAAKKEVQDETTEIETEKVQADKLWAEIKNMKGNLKRFQRMFEKGDNKKLWAELMQLKKEIAENEAKLKELKEEDAIDLKAIDKTKAAIEHLVKEHASNKTIAELVLLLDQEVDKDNSLKADMSVAEADIKQEIIEAKKIWAEIKNNRGFGGRRHHGGDERRHHRNHRHHENPREELRDIVHEKEDVMHRERKDGWEKKFLNMNDKKMAYEKEEIAKLKKEGADPKKIEYLEKDLEERWAKELDVKKQLEVDAKMIPAENADLEEKWVEFDRDTQHHDGGHQPWWRRHHQNWWGGEGQGHHNRCPGRHGHHGGHDGHHGHHHRHHHCCPVPWILAGLFTAHMIFLHKYRKSLHDLNEAKKAPAVQVDQEQPAGFVAVPIAPTFSINADVDKQEYPVVSQPTNYVISKNNNIQ